MLKKAKLLDSAKGNMLKEANASIQQKQSIEGGDVRIPAIFQPAMRRRSSRHKESPSSAHKVFGSSCVNSVMQNTLCAPGRRARSAERLKIA